MGVQYLSIHKNLFATGRKEKNLTVVEAPAGRYDETTVEVEYVVFDTVETGPVTVAVLEAVTVLLLVAMMSTNTPHETV